MRLTFMRILQTIGVWCLSAVSLLLWLFLAAGAVATFLLLDLLRLVKPKREDSPCYTCGQPATTFLNNHYHRNRGLCPAHARALGL